MNTITPSEAFRLIGTLPTGTFALIDVRSPEEFTHTHVEGSINIPMDTVVELADTLRAYRHVFLYCRSGNRSGKACMRLHGANIPNAVSILGGIDEMKGAGFAVRTSSNVFPLQQQIFIAAGSIIALGVMLTAFASPWFLLIPLFVSLGLLYAGLSGNCMMARVLMSMPWNTVR